MFGDLYISAGCLNFLPFDQGLSLFFQPAGDHIWGAYESQERFCFFIWSEAYQTISGVPGSRWGQKTEEDARWRRKSRRFDFSDKKRGLPERCVAPQCAGCGLAPLCQAPSAQSVADPRSVRRVIFASATFVWQPLQKAVEHVSLFSALLVFWKQCSALLLSSHFVIVMQKNFSSHAFCNICSLHFEEQILFKLCA